jgi:hypothetical protein
VAPVILRREGSRHNPRQLEKLVEEVGFEEEEGEDDDDDEDYGEGEEGEKLATMSPMTAKRGKQTRLQKKMAQLMSGARPTTPTDLKPDSAG